MTISEYRSVAQISAEWGVAVPCAGNLPVDIGDPGFAWYIESGAVDLFLVERRDGVEQAAPQHLLRAAAGRLLPGAAPQTDVTTLSLIAKGVPGTVLRRLPATRLGELRSAEIAAQIDAWVTDVSTMLSRDVMHHPRPDAHLESGTAPAPRSGTLGARRGVVWMVGLAAGDGLFMDLIDPAESAVDGGGARALPLTPASWLTLTQESRISAESSATLAERGLLLPALNGFHQMAFALERLNRRLAVVDQANLERARATSRRRDETGARRRLFNLYGLAEATLDGAGDTALREALRAIGRHAGIAFKHPTASGPSTPADTLARVLEASGIRGRRVRLASEDRWWIGDSGAMLAFRADDERPVALLPGVWGSYREVDPVDGRTRRITAARAATLRPEAWVFYPSLKSSGAAPRDLLGIIRAGMTADLARIMTTGLLGGLVMLLPAVAIGLVTEQVIPAGETGLLYGISVALAAFGLVRALLQVLQGMALMRLEGRATARMEAAFWDRLLQLPSRVLQRYPAGNLALRGMTFQNLRDAAQDVVGNGLLSLVFLSPAFLLIAFYDPALGGLTATFGLLSLLVTVVLGMRQMAPHGRMLRAAQGLAGRLFQLINGISKLRVDGAEGSAFAVWARDYREQKRAELQLGAIETHLQAFGNALPLLAAAALLLAMTLSGRNSFAVGDFIAVYVLFALYQAAVRRLGESFRALAAVMPALDQIRPLLAEPTETDTDGESVKELRGEIVFDHVTFRYDPEGPAILDDVSIHAGPGEFVAVAGESGAGKSTLLRLALGLEQPSGGSVYYDGRDLRHLNLKQVRRQVGVVPQVVQLHPQDLWDNIVGDREGVAAEDAWEAARIAAVDREIAAMPMGMLTPVGASAAVMSGGESQRIRIAHALLGDPRILLLDEATNWLDNDTQSRVMANLSRLASTRIVIAHRLSTLREADRIYVMRAGKVVQEGTFRELESVPGAFRDLVRRQVA